MEKEERDNFFQENNGEALNRFKSSLLSGRKSYFDISEFEEIVEHFLDEGDINASEIAARQGMQIHPEAVELQLKYAEVLLNQGKNEVALKHLNFIQKIDANNPDVFLLRGVALLLLGDEEKAKKSFRRSLRYSGSDNDEILHQIGNAYVQAGKIDTAVQYFEEALTINPKNFSALEELGFFSDLEGNFQKSIDYYNRYLDIDPFNFSIWFNLGFSQSGAGNYEKAIEAYEYASLLNDKYTYALFNLGNAYANAGKFSKAIEKYTEYLEFDPNNDDAWSYTGECYLNLEEHSRADYYYGKALKINPENVNAWFGKGLVKWIEKNWDESIAFMKKAIKYDKQNSDYWVALAKVFNESNRIEEAEEAVVNASELEPENAEVWLTWADILLKNNKLSAAVKTLKNGIKQSDSPLLKYRMVSLLLESKKDKEAYEMLESAMQQDFTQIHFLYEIYPPAFKNRRLRKRVENFRKRSDQR
jgi:tetratricopeptide (TPR) repeat protein